MTAQEFIEAAREFQKSKDYKALVPAKKDHLKAFLKILELHHAGSNDNAKR